MEKLKEFVKDNKALMCMCWLAIVFILFLFFSKIFSNSVTMLQIIWICGISLIIYWAIVFTLTYQDSNKKLKWISSITDQFVHMQIFLDNNTLVIEILEGEVEVLEELAKSENFKVERIAEYNDLVKVIIK